MRTTKSAFVYKPEIDRFEKEEKIIPVKLVLPPAHERQHYFISTLERQPEVRFVAGACGTKFGKLLWVETPVPTPTGWTTIGQIKEGDYVFDIDGKPTLVEYITDVITSLKSYEVTFSDNSKVIVDAGHLWETQTLDENGLPKASVVSTEQIKNTLIVNEDSYNHAVQCVTSPVEFTEQKLGDVPYRVGYESVDNKYIPKEYLLGSVSQRQELFSGLRDRVRSINKSDSFVLSSANKPYIYSVASLLASLGHVSKVCNVDYVYYVALVDTSDRRYIVSVEEVPSVPMRCLRVASPRHLFLVTKSFIPTHNTFGSAIAMVKYAWDHKDSLNWWVAPTYKQAEMAYDLIKRMLPEGAYLEYKADLKLKILSPTGKEHSVIEFKSGDNSDSLRGFGVKFFVMDEAARIPYESYLSLLTTVTQTKGKGFYISTPKGRGWFYDVYQKGVKTYEDGTPIYGPDNPDPHPEWFSVRLPTWTNPHVDLTSVQDMKNNLPEDDFRQEVAAEFLLESAGVFRGIKDCIKGTLLPPQPGRRYVMGVDLARLRDFTVITILDMKSKHLVYHERFNQMSWEVQYHKILEVAKRYNHALTYMDATGIGDPVIEAVQRAGLRVVPYKITGSVAKQQLIDKLRVNIENQNISFPYVRELVNELECYEVSVTEGGVAKYSAPQGKHDDCVISLALAVWGVDTAPFVYRYANVRGI